MRNINVIAMNADGFGVRLCALINAIAVSEALKCNFKFTWKDTSANIFHTVESVTNTFSSDFIEDYYLDSHENLNVKPLTDLLKYNQEDEYFRATLSIDSFVNKYDKISVISDIVDRSSSFKKIKFSKKLQSIIELANSIDIPNNSIALHLRAGDIIFGNFRQSGFYAQKVLSFPIAIKLINDLQSKNINVIIFGQDQSLCRVLEDNYKVLLSKNLITEKLDNEEASLFDIILMSRCKEIFAGHSGFSIASSLIGNIKIIDINKDFSEEYQSQTILEFLGERKNTSLYSSEQLGYACLSALTFGHNSLNFLDYIYVCENGYKADNTNFSFVFLKIIKYYSQSEFTHAEQLAEDVFNNLEEFEKLKIYLKLNLGNSSLKKFFNQKNYLVPIENAVDKSKPYAYVLLLMCYYYSDEKEKFKQYLSNNQIKGEISINLYDFLFSLDSSHNIKL
jgi:hypothetical protein